MERRERNAGVQLLRLGDCHYIRSEDVERLNIFLRLKSYLSHLKILLLMLFGMESSNLKTKKMKKITQSMIVIKTSYYDDFPSSPDGFW